MSLAAAPEVEDQQGSHKRTVRRPTLLYGTRDSEGGGITLDTISADDLVEVDSREFGRVTFRVTGDAEPLRRRRSLIGFEIALARVDEEAFTAAVS